MTEIQPPNRQTREVERIAAIVGDLFSVDAYYLRGNKLALSLQYRYSHEKSLELLRDRLELAGYRFELSAGEDSVLLTVDPRRRLRIPRLNVILFLATIVTVYLVPAYYFEWDLASGGGIEFTIAMMSILVVHEMGHFIASRRRNIVTSWPFFIPAPTIIGTFGAVIKSKSPFWNRRDLLEVGAAGPVAGWIVAVGWMVYGLSKLQQVPAEMFADAGLWWGSSILSDFLLRLVAGAPDPGHVYAVNEAWFAGWVGLLVTAINMLPIGQLDGGHVLYGLFRGYQRPLGTIAMIALVVMGFQSHMWWLFAAMGLIFGVAHPPTINDNKKPSLSSRILGWVALVILILSFTPVPFVIR